MFECLIPLLLVVLLLIWILDLPDRGHGEAGRLPDPQARDSPQL